MHPAFIVTALLAALSACVSVPAQGVNSSPPDWQEEFNIANRKLTPTGESKYFILVPGFQTILASQKAKLIIFKPN